MKIIDCHTHIQNEKMINDYFKNKKNYFAIAINSPEYLLGNGKEFYESTQNKKKLFILEYIDINLNIIQQLQEIEKHLKIYKIIGIKIYLGYQHIYANDERLFPVYEFAEKNGLTITFHSGIVGNAITELALLKYTTCEPVDELAVRFPKVNFIISHLDFPNFLKCSTILDNNDNVYSDISGMLESQPNLKVKKLMRQIINNVKECYTFYPSIHKKIMFGSDYYGEESSYFLVNEYVYMINKIFGKKNKENHLWNNCLNAYPKIKVFLQNN